jgi:hypothetical protein
VSLCSFGLGLERIAEICVNFRVPHIKTIDLIQRDAKRSVSVS